MSRPLSTSFRSRVTAKAHLARCEPPGTFFVVGVLHVLEDVSKQRHIKGEVPAGFLVIEVDVSRVSRSAPHVTDRAALRPSRRAVVAGKQRRGRATRALRISADDAAFPCVTTVFRSGFNPS